ncbi:MAG TPA: hypothetical protein VEY09_10015 [Pyrinomonadaceae bacterium]|nr:hypothetical protein [Pyrinomonadaceae bacterium]
MRPKDYALVILLALCAGLSGRAWGERVQAVPAAEARVAAQRDDGRKWEYCAVTKAQFVGSNRGGVYWISYFRGDRVQVETVETGPTGNAMAKAVAKLGEENWEMVGEGPLEVRAGVPGGTPNALFFKRRLEER